MGKKEFAIAALNPEHKTFVIHVASFSSTPLNVHLFYRPWISGLITKKALTKIFNKYVDLADVFSLDLVSKLFEHTGINNHAIKLVDGQQLLYGPIYSLGPVKLETLKAYIETNLANGLIRPFKSPASAFILFDRKLDGFFQLYVNYRGLNHLTIKNQYLLSLVGESLDRLKRAKQFTQLDITSIYHQMSIHKGNK